MSSFNWTTDCQLDAGDTSWVATSTLLVLAMKPGLGLFEAGLLRPKNTISILAQIFIGMMVLCLLWFIIGFSLTFGDSLGGVIGNPGTYPLFLYPSSGMGQNGCLRFAPSIPGTCFATFQMMFAAITPLLQTGTFADRMKFPVYLAYICLWEVLVYYPLAHWIWGGGWLFPNGVNNHFPAGDGVIDFAGGITIHTSSGVSALVTALMVGKRLNFKKHHGVYRPADLITACIGAGLLWVGWFGFNGGSALTSGSSAALAVLNTQMGGCVTGLIWVLLHWLRTGKPSLTIAISGGIAGLAGITPVSGYISQDWALLVAAIIGFASYGSAYLIKDIFKIDDALDVFSIHGVSGIIGSISIGFFASVDVNSSGQNGLIAGHGIQIAYQLLGVTLACALGVFWTFVILKALDLTVGIRVPPNEERIGLSFTEHGEFVDDHSFEKFRHWAKKHKDILDDYDFHDTEDDTKQQQLDDLSKKPKNKEESES